MATTDARTGFRLPWSAEQHDENDDNGSEGTAPDAEGIADTESTEPTAETPVHGPDDTVRDSAETHAAPSAPVATTPQPAPVAPEPVKPTRARPSKFLADLTKAMQAAAEAAREETLARVQADAKSHIEEIHARSSDDAAALRRAADDDVAAIREWSKTEIARIREETESRITGRKAQLEGEIEAHAGRIERRIENVQGAVAAFEGEMASFFERLLAEEDPTRFAAMAESLPEPTPFAYEGDDTVAVAGVPVHEPAPVVEAVVEVAPEPEPVVEAVVEPEAVVETVVEPEAVVEVAPEPEPVVEAVVEPEPVVEAVAPVAEVTPEPPPAEELPPVEAHTEATTEDLPTTADVQVLDAPTFEVEAPAEVDPRLAALAMAPPTADAELGSETATDESAEEGEEIPVIADDALAARLAGLVASPDAETPAEVTSTRVVVTGLVSVASIASFKRHLARLDGVQSVGVTSGPEGEFIFTVSHGRDVAVRDTIPTLPGFQARVTGSEEGLVVVSAHDPETEG